ncbi:hypothetical protein C0993_007172 [Termitomyces sp. T159_Od127]|nr:hypothetical protein C0993_007172 [Termitomyces sp. T159_Od127]
MNLDEKLDSVEKGMKSIDESLDPLLQIASTPTLQSDGNPHGNAILLRKRATLQAEWETIRNESDVLREELREDKWLTVFRTVTDQADGMMSSLEKAVNRCQITRTNRPTPVTPLSINKNIGKREPASEPVPAFRQQKTSFFSSMRGSQPTTPITPDRPGHKYSQSLTPDTSPLFVKADSSTVKLRVTPPPKQRWNSSTKVEQESASKGTPPKRPPSATGTYATQGDIPPVPPLGAAYRRSISRASMVSSRPWSPVTSTSTTQSSQPTHFPIFRPASRAQTPAGSRGVTPGLGTTPRRRPKTPSHIPQPSKQLHTTSSFEDNEEDDSPDLQRAFSPTLSMISSGFMGHPPRPPSRSMIPVPNLQFSTPSRPSSSMSFRSSAVRAQTPESTLRANAQRIALFSGTPARKGARPSGVTKLPPSSFKDSSASRAPSRPGSRNGAYTPNLEMHEYVPSNPKDPLDAEVAAIANSTAHSLLIERLDPPLRTIPKPGEEVKARYAFTNSLSRKELTLRLTTLTRPGKVGEDTTSTKRVMCRIGGGTSLLLFKLLSL